MVLYGTAPAMARTSSTENAETAVDLAPRPPGGASGGAKPRKPSYVVEADKPLKQPSRRALGLS